MGVIDLVFQVPWVRHDGKLIGSRLADLPDQDPHVEVVLDEASGEEL